VIPVDADVVWRRYGSAHCRKIQSEKIASPGWTGFNAPNSVAVFAYLFR
jgi:hypothetical protein